MMDRMLHRGPDAGSTWLDPSSGWTFGHRRLSIIDLSESGTQPMVSASGRFVITYNGEIYNHKVLRERLVKEGRVTEFRGTSDTEVLVEAIEAYGLEKTLEMSKGMFGLAVYDRQEKVLKLARDRAGEKPLYYGFIKDANDNKYFAFASDCAVLTKLPGFHQAIDRKALANYMTYKFIPTPMSIYEGIYKLEPGSVLTLKAPGAEPEIKSYWSMREAARYGEEHPFKGSYEEARDHLEALLTDAIRDQMCADVPVGSFLSGGIDSPLVSSLMQKLSDKPIHTFTIGYDDPKINEAQFAKEISEHLGTDHTELSLTEHEMREVITKLPYYFSEPMGDSSVISTYFVSKLARSKVTVSLSGDTGDELFCGYSRYWQTGAMWEKLSKVPGALRGAAGSILSRLPGSSSPFLYKSWNTLKAENVNQLKEMIQYRRVQDAEKIVIGAGLEKIDSIGAYVDDIYAAMQLNDIETYYLDDCLYKVDRAGMAFSLENRIPMLDKDFVEFAWTLPTEFKYKDGVSKRILRDILYKYVPREMLERPKQGFWIPMYKWLLEGETFEYTNELLNNMKLAEDGLVNGGEVKRVWKEFQENKKEYQLVFNLLIAEQWYRKTAD